MKKTILLTALLLLLLVTVPVYAKNAERVGNQISIWWGYYEQPQGEPFHIAHGFVFLPPDDLPIGQRYFELEMDGVVLQEDFIERGRNKDSGLIDRIWVYNFPDGLSGFHEFVGRYIKSCRYAMLENGYPGPCEHPNEPIVVLEQLLIVNFY
jgi:hypothetical protein